MVITIILLISGMFLSLSPGDGGGLPAGQRVMVSSLRTVRAMALMNRGTLGTGIPQNPRYRLLILNDPSDLEGHLRTVCVAVGAVKPGVVDPSTVTVDSANYLWYAPEAPVRLPQGVYFVPPSGNSETVVNYPPDWQGAVGTRRSIIGALADNLGSGELENSSSPPKMKFLPLNQPDTLTSMSGFGSKQWFYVEIQPTGQSNHLGRVMLVLALGSLRPGGVGTVNLDVSGDSKFSAVALRPSGEISMTTGPEEMDGLLLTK